MRDVEFRNYSQNGEDGILVYLAATLGLRSRRIVEIGCGDGIECNSANLLVHHGWDGLLIDGNNDALARGRAFYARQAETQRVAPRLVHSWITRDNIASTLAEHGFADDVAVMSVDIDGNDLWVLEAAEPTADVVVVEYNNRIPAGLVLAVPYREDFVGDASLDGGGFFGASLSAFALVLGRRGYRLIGANSVNTNAFFARVGENVLPAVSIESCLSSRWAQRQQERWPAVSGRDWHQVS
jgi:hypothetical protein